MSEKTKKALDELKRLRDEIRVRVDLAGKEAKTWWDDLEPQFSQVEGKIASGGEKVADVSRTVADEMASAFRRIRDRIGGEQAKAEEGSSEDTAEEASSDADEATDAEIVDE